jgi:hypothetical protein
LDTCIHNRLATIVFCWKTSSKKIIVPKAYYIREKNVKKAVFAVTLTLALISMHQMRIQPFFAQAQEIRGLSHSCSKAEEDALIHDIATASLTMGAQIVDNYMWATDAVSADGLDNFGLPGRTAVPVDAAAYDGYGKPYWTGNFSLSYPIEYVNQINVTYLPFTPDNYTVTLTEGVDYFVHTYAIDLLTSLDVPIINEHWVDGVNNTVSGWAAIGYVATGIQSVYVKFPNGTERFARNYGYMAPPPSEWWYDPDWPWEFERLLCFCCSWDWPAGSEWWVNYTAASYLTVDYTAIAPPVIHATLDISPNALNLQSKGEWFFSHIELPEGHNPSNIDVSTILLNNTVPVDLAAPIVVGDYDNDNVSDLMITFNRTEIVEYIISKGITCGNVTLTVTGELHKIGSFRGSDSMKVSSLVGDVNCDGIVDLYDVVMMVSIYGCREGEPQWNPNADLAPQYGVIDIYDFITCAYHYGQEYS